MSSASYKHWVLNKAGVRKIHICAITNANGETFVGHAICSPEDEYNAERGREIAQGRALKEYRNNGLRGGYLRAAFDARIQEERHKIEDIIVSEPAFFGGDNRFD
jgi:hypothetical protein